MLFYCSGGGEPIDYEKIIKNLKNENIKLKLELERKHNVVGYFGSEYNKCFPLLRKDMSVINIDLLICDNNNHFLRTIECKPMYKKFDVNDNSTDGKGQKWTLRTLARIFKIIMDSKILNTWKLYQYVLWYNPDEIPKPKHIKLHNITTGKKFDLYNEDVKIWNEGYFDEDKI